MLLSFWLFLIVGAKLGKLWKTMWKTQLSRCESIKIIRILHEIKSNKTMSKESNPEKAPAPVLPRGMAVRGEEDEPRPESLRRSVTYPDQEFYQDFYYLCYKFGKSCNEVHIGYASQFIEDNKQYLPKKKK